ncbi:hypothetical protein ABZ319_04785 [Nocardia sp. NPDC005978]|uniref:hypothetical protein n=1 Tax=Nocardia sp. NPDC005978 TaxID=3156725 RepID=UPI0033BA0AFC
MRGTSVALTTVFAGLTAIVTAVSAYAAPVTVDTPAPPSAADTDDPGADQILLSCPPTPDADDPMAPIPERDPLCGENDLNLYGDIYLRSNAYRRLSTIYGPDVAVSIIGNNHFQLRDHSGNLILGEDRSTLHHIPFGREIPRPRSENQSNLTPHELALQEGLSRVTVGIMQGVVYTGDLTDMSALLTTPIGSVLIQAPGTGADPLLPGPGGDRELRLLNNFQVLDAQGRYVMGNTLTLGSPMALWPNAAVPCPIGTVPVSRVPRDELDRMPENASAAGLPDPVCKAPASVPIVDYIDDPAAPDGAAPPPGGIKPNQDPVQRQKDINDAYSAVGTQFGLAVAIGGLIGGMTGLVIGCLAGGIGVGAAGTFSAALAGTATGFAGGCLTGASLLGAMGTTIGSLAIGVPVGIIAGVNAYETLRLQGDVARKPIAADVAVAQQLSAPNPLAEAERDRLVSAGIAPELAAAVPAELAAAVPTEVAAAVAPALAAVAPAAVEQQVRTLVEEPVRTLIEEPVRALLDQPVELFGQPVRELLGVPLP